MATTLTTEVHDAETRAVGIERFDRVPLLFGPSQIGRASCRERVL